MNFNNPKPGYMRIVALSGVSEEVVKASAERTALTFAAIGGTVFLSDVTPVVAGQGLPIVDTAQPFTICQCHAGAFVKKPVYAIPDGAATHLIVIEGYEPAGAGDYTYGPS